MKLLFLVILAVLVFGVFSIGKAGELKLTWNDNSTNETGFIINRKTTPTGVLTEIVRVPANSTAYSDTVPDAQEYCYEVRAYNAGGVSTPTNEDCGISTEIIPPDGAPSSLVTTTTTTTRTTTSATP